MQKITAHLSAFEHRGAKQIKIDIPNTEAAKQRIRSISGRKWSKTHGCWYLPYSTATLEALRATFEVIYEEKKAFPPQAKPPLVATITPTNLTTIMPSIIAITLADGRIQKRVIGDHVTLLVEHEKRFKAFVPFDKKGWIEVVQQIPGRAWNAEQAYWSVPYVKDSFRRIWAMIGKENIQLGFTIRTDIPADYPLPQAKHAPRKSPNYSLSEQQQRALMALEQRLILEHKSWRTIKTYKGLFHRFLMFYPNEKPSSISAAQLEKYIIVRKQQDNISDSQINQLINTLNAFYVRILEQPEKLLRIKRPKKKKKMPNVFSMEEIERLLKACDNIKHKAILILVYSAGLRKGELLDLRVHDISFERKTIVVKNGKGGKDRYTLFSDTAQKYMRQYLRIYAPKYYLFEGQTGGRYSESSMQAIFEQTRQKAQVNRFVTLHGLRHSFATHLIEKNVPLHVVQQLLGHSSIKTTEVYLHISNKFRKELKSPLDDLNI